MKFDVKLKLSLDFLGEGWGECFLAFSPITVKQAKDFREIDVNDPLVADKGLEIMQEQFLGGKGLSEGKIVDIKKEDIEDLPISVVTKAIELMISNMVEVEKKIVN